jgi:lysophospholipase L1-like esterase
VHAVAALAFALSGVGLLAGCSQDEDGPGVTRRPDDPAQYVALGDSYTSAPGVGHTVEEGCLRSSSNYPSLVADELNLTLDDVSCAGAATTELVGVQDTTTGPRPPQLDALNADTEVVTLSIGGNDEALFGGLLVQCLELGREQSTGSPCRDLMNQGGTDTISATIARIRGRITSSLLAIQDRAPNAEVVLVGYPQLVPGDRVRCATLPLAAGDYAYLRDTMIELGEATAQAAADAKTRYVDLLAASDGHDVCAGAEAWISGAVSDPKRPGAAMHPFAEEQVAVAELVVEALED